jgi:hypothetical protein
MHAKIRACNAPKRDPEVELMTDQPETMTINGHEYVLKESLKEKTVECERYKTQDEAKLHKALRKFLNEDTQCISEQEALNRDVVAVMDPANVLMVIAKSDRAKMVLRRYIYFEDKEVKPPELKYDDVTDEPISKYSVEYLHHIINFLSTYDKISDDVGSVKIKVKNDYPVTWLNDEWEIILSPRIDND